MVVAAGGAKDDVGAATATGTTAGRRAALLSAAALAAAALPSFSPPPARASKLPAAADRAWQAVTGAPPDLAFPEYFLGTWRAQSSLVAVDTPQGEDLVGPAGSPALAALARARRDELNAPQPLGFRVRFVRNSRGAVVFDRAFNVASLAAGYAPLPSKEEQERERQRQRQRQKQQQNQQQQQQPQQQQQADELALMRQIEWSLDDPNVLVIRAPTGNVRTRVTRRSEAPAPPSDPAYGEGGPADAEAAAAADASAPRAFETSEFMEQVFEGAGALAPGGTLAPPRVTASQVFVKWRWRTAKEAEAASAAAAAAATAAGGGGGGGRAPLIVATQVVSNFLTPYDGDEVFLRAGNRPVVTYTYRLAMVRDDGGEGA